MAAAWAMRAGSGAGQLRGAHRQTRSPTALPGLREAREQARRRDVGLVIPPTAQAIGALTESTEETNAILHLTR